MKKYIMGLITGAIIILGITTFANGLDEKIAQIAEFSLTIDGTKRDLSSMYVIDDKTYVPLREFSNMMNYNIVWEDGLIDIVTKVDTNIGSDWKVFKQNGLYGYKDSNGNIMIEPKLRHEPLDSFHDGMALIQDEEDGVGWGYINTEGDIVISCQFAQATNFRDGIACVSDFLHSEAGLIAMNGVSQFGRYYYIDKAGNKVLSVRGADILSEFSEGYASVAKHLNAGITDTFPTLCSFINMKGEFVTDKEFQATDSFKNGYAMVKNQDKWGLINKDFQLVIDYQYDTTEDLKKSSLYNQYVNR